MVFDTMYAVIIQDAAPDVNQKRKNKPENLLLRRSPAGRKQTGLSKITGENFFGELEVDITMLKTLWIMCKTPAPEWVRGGDGGIMEK